MKRCLVILLLLLSQMAFSQGWEWLNPLPQGNDLMELQVLAPTLVLSAGNYGAAIVSTDGGAVWTIRNTGERPFPYTMKFVSETEGWGLMEGYTVFGDDFNHAVVHSTDGGQSWQRSYQNFHLELEDLSFPSAQQGWVVAHVDSTLRLAILHTTDGGQTWNVQASDSNGHRAKVFFLNEQEGWISLVHSILHTTNGGQTWEAGYSSYWMAYGLYFTDSQNGYGASFSGIYRTTTGGQFWTDTEIPLIPSEGTRSMAVIDSDHLWVVTGTDGDHDNPNHILFSTDGGQTWARRSAPTKANLNNVLFADAQHGWICGERGTVLQTVDGGTTWALRGGNPITERYSNFGAVDFADRQNGWRIGGLANGYTTILHTTDGGAHWTNQYPDTNRYFADLRAVSATEIWAVGHIVTHSTDGGLHWTTVAVGANAACYNVVCPDERTIWIFSGTDDSPYVHRSTDGGATWTTHRVPLTLKYNGMAAGDANNVWISGWTDLDEGTVLHSSNGGLDWETQGDSLGFLDGIFFIDAQYGWAGAGPGIVRTTDGGAHWTVVGPRASMSVRRIQFIDRMTGWVLGYGDAYRTLDGGTTWQHFNPFVDTGLADIDLVDANQAWVSGWDGILLRFDGTNISAPDHPAVSSPASLELSPVYPNPFNATTTIAYVVPQTERISLRVFDLLGREVAVLRDGMTEAGPHVLQFDGSRLASGMYFTRLEAGSQVQTQKMILLK
jgi:photosystem II stability/assembly factor-like uncharacterized protein